jgi:hypothetical protein
MQQVFTVYHKKAVDYRADQDKVYDIKDYEIVADVTTNDLNNVYSLTNSIERYWGDNNAVYEFEKERKKRSTSIGDIIRLDTNEGSKYFMVDSCGFFEAKVKL